MNAKLPRPKRTLPPNGRAHPLIMAFLLGAGGTAKTTSTISLGTIFALRGYRVRIFDLDFQCTASEILNHGPNDLDENQPTVFSLIKGDATLDEATVQGRLWNGEKPEGWDDEEDGEYEEYVEIPNLFLVPGDEEMKNCDTYMTTEPDSFQWFWELICRYRDGERTAEENEVWLFDLPATYGRLTVSVLLGMDEHDAVLPPVIVTSKEAGQLDKLIDELVSVAERYRKRAMPARPRVENVLLCSTPTASHDSREYHQTIDEIEQKFPGKVLPYVRYSAVATSQHRRRCPIPIFDPKSRPATDYNAVADCLGFPDLEPEEN